MLQIDIRWFCFFKRLNLFGLDLSCRTFDMVAEKGFFYIYFFKYHLDILFYYNTNCISRSLPQNLLSRGNVGIKGSLCVILDLKLSNTYEVLLQ